MVCSTDRSKAVVPVLVLLFVALWFILRGDLLYVFPCVIFFLCFSVLLVLRLPRLGKRELILVLFIRLFGLCLFRFVSLQFLLWSGKGWGLWLLHSLDFSLTYFSKLSTYDFSTLYTTLPLYLIKDKLIDLINRTFIRENTQYLACNEECAFFTSDVYKNHNLLSCQKVCDALVYLLDNIFIRFGTNLYRQTIGISMGTNCAPLVADLFLFCYERCFMKSFSREYQADIIEAFNSTSRYLHDLLNIDNIYFDQMVDRIYPTELQLNRANSSDTEAPFLDLNLCISNGTVSAKIYDKRDDFDFDIVNFPFLDGDVPRRTSYGVYISQLIRFARASSNLNDFNYRNKALTAKLLRQGYRYFKLLKAFSKFYRKQSALLEKYSVSLKKTSAKRYIGTRILWWLSVQI